jgi:glyoxylase-like metal-dependent hydrolase (beta-lactamase superfamily II)
MYTGCSIEVRDGQRCIIDPASDPDELKTIAESGVGVMIHSHIHGDHILYSEFFDKAQLWVPEKEAVDYGDQDQLAREFGISEEMAAKWRHTINQHEKKAFYMPIHRKLEIGERVHIGECEIVIHSLLGHTRGSVGLEFPAQRTVYSGDVDLTSFGPWYGHIHSDIDLFIDSSKKLSELDADWFITGHEAGVVTAEEFRRRLPEYLGIIDRRDEKILENLDQPRTPDELVKRGILYPPHTVNNEWIVHWERAHLEKHLERLTRLGRVKLVEDGRYLPA